MHENDHNRLIPFETRVENLSMETLLAVLICGVHHYNFVPYLSKAEAIRESRSYKRKQTHRRHHTSLTRT